MSVMFWKSFHIAVSRKYVLKQIFEKYINILIIIIIIISISI
jgi:hypothetical protein